MSEEELEVVLLPDGEVELVTHGVKGKRCIDYVKALVQAVGRVKSSEKTAEFYEEEAAVHAGTQVNQDVRRK